MFNYYQFIIDPHQSVPLLPIFYIWLRFLVSLLVSLDRFVRICRYVPLSDEAHGFFSVVPVFQVFGAMPNYWRGRMHHTPIAQTVKFPVQKMMYVSIVSFYRFNKTSWTVKRSSKRLRVFICCLTVYSSFFVNHHHIIMEYEVERIKQWKIKKNQKEFFVKWVGYGAKECSWVKEADLNCPEILNTFLSRLILGMYSMEHDLTSNFTYKLNSMWCIFSNVNLSCT